MAIDAATIDTAAAAQRPVPRERTASPIINDGHNSRGVEIKGEMSFGDFLDIINPLQHIPVVSNIYREITGDTIKPASKVIGGILYGGPVGGMASIANAVVEEAQGKDFGDQIMASLGFGGGSHTAPDAATAVAAKPDETNPNRANPAAATAAAAAQTAPQAAPPQVAAADKPVRLNASAAPPEGTQAAAGGSARDALAAGAAAHPTRMPPRDTPLANSMMARHAAPKYAAPMHGATLVHGQAAASGNAGSSSGSAAGSAASAGQGGSAGAAGSGSAAAGSAAKATGGLVLEAQDGAAPNVMTPVSPDMLSETMMRNLAKYEQSRKAAQSAAPSLRVSG